MELAASNTNPSAKYMSVLIELTPLNPSLLMYNIHITAFISAGRSGEDAILPPCSKLTSRMRISSTTSFAEKEPTRAFVTFILSVVHFYTNPKLLSRVSVAFAHAQFIAFPAGLGLAMETRLRACRSRKGKISVKCQFAKNIWDFCEKGECGALAMILFNRLIRLGGPDVL